MPTPLCSLHTARPTPTTLSFTVSTRTPLQSIGWRIFYRFVLILRLIFVCQILLLLWIKWEFTFESASLKGIPLWLIDSAPGRIGTRLVTAIPGQYLVPLCLFCLWVLVKRGYTDESLLVLRGLGVQTTTSSSTYLSTATTRFIPTTAIQDIFIHEAFKGFEVRFYLAIVVEGEEDVVVVFPSLLPGRDILEEVWRGARQCLYEPKP